MVLLPRSTAAKKLSVASQDGTVSVTVDEDSGMVTRITTRGVENEIIAGSTLEGTIQLQLTVTQEGAAVVVENLVCIKAADVPCSMYQALVTDTFTPTGTSVEWKTNVSSPVTRGYPVPLWSRPLVTNVTYKETGQSDREAARGH